MDLSEGWELNPILLLLMLAKRPSGTSFPRGPQTVLQEIRVVVHTELIVVHGLNKLPYHKMTVRLGKDTHKD